MTSKQWRVQQIYDSTFGDEKPAQVQVFPDEDATPHLTDGNPCWCNPHIGTVENGAKVVVHFAVDGRASREPGWDYLHGAN